MSNIIRNLGTGLAAVERDGKTIGYAERITIGVETAPGQFGSREYWFAVTGTTVTHAHPERSGCPQFDTRKSAAEWIATHG